jgi:hypothetical protein
MTTLKNQIDRLNWTSIATDLDSEGYALLPGLLSAAQIDALSSQVSDQLSSQVNELPLRSMSLARREPGHGQLFFFENNLPEVLAVLRTQLYHHLAPIANRWNNILQLGYRYPDTLDRFLQANRDAGQNRELSHLHRLQESDYIALHQRNDGQLVFPLQAVLLLSEPGQNFRGGELVMTEQRPRMQSRPIVLSMRQVDVAIISTGQRPFKGSHGFYRVNTKHAISRVYSGQRSGLELFFHHAPGDDQRDTYEQGSLLDTDRN